MSNARQETIADIMSEMREYADSMEKHLLYDLRECPTDYLRVLADRIEAAVMYQFREAAKMIHNQEVAVSKMETTTSTSEKSSAVGNAAEMREALNDAYSCAILNLLKTQNVEYVEIANALDKAKAVLAKQQRNCDRPECATTKEAQDTWRKEDGGQTAYYEWLFAEAKGYEKMSEKAGGIE